MVALDLVQTVTNRLKEIVVPVMMLPSGLNSITACDLWIAFS
jgi:hypothetical protein